MTQTRDAARSRTFSWSDPAANATELGRRSGLELLHAMIAGELPPARCIGPCRPGSSTPHWT